MTEHSADAVRRSEARGERNAYLMAYAVALVTWLLLKALGWGYFGPTSNLGLLWLAYLAHRRLRPSDGRDDADAR